jgi:hypothetical protein
MADATINIYVDLTFSTTVSGSKDTDVDLTLADADVIGAYNIPVVYTTAEASIGESKSLNVEYITSSGTVSGTLETNIDFNLPTLISGTNINLVDYNIGSITSGTLNKYIDCFIAGDTGISGVPPVSYRTRDTLVNYIVGNKIDGTVADIPVSFWTWTSISGSKNLTTEYTYLGSTNVAIDKTADLTFGAENTMLSGSKNSYVDLTFSGDVLYSPYLFDLYCTLQNTKYIDSELTVISGAVNYYLTEIICGVSGTQTVDIDVYCCLTDYVVADYEVTVISGAIDKLNYEVYSCAQTTGNLSFDVDLLSLKISNFSPSADDYAYTGDGISVDITDDVYSVLTSASGIPCSGTCCLKVDNTAVPVTFSGITDGYRMYYTPTDEFSTLAGSTEFTVHAENSNGDILERNYYLTYGYLVEYDNTERVGLGYGYGAQVLVRMAAENLATCHKSSADAYYFTTEQRKPVDLGASIVGLAFPEDYMYPVDLGAQISPQSTAFFYGKTFRVILNAKDFAGNEMEPYEFEFKIEDAPD